MSVRDKRIERAQMKVLFQVPFFAPGVAKLPVVWDDTIETACTAGENIRFSPKFCDSLSDGELVTVLCHEVAHCLLGHVWRAPAGCDWGVWNQATDHAVNNMLREFAEQVTARNLSDPFPMPKAAACCDPAFRNMAEEVIYNRLAKGGGGGGGGQGQGGAGGGGGGQGQGGAGGGPGKAQPSIGQIGPAAGQAAGKAKAVQADWQHTLTQAVAACKGRGDLPGSVARAVDGFLHPKVPWWDLLRNFLREQCDDDWNWMKPNRLFEDCEFILPSLDSERIGSVVFAVDTSGSIDRDLLKQFKTEMQGCLDELRPARVVEICCDTRITVERNYVRGDQILPDAPGGGGTSFEPVFERIGQWDEAPKCVVYLTDLDGSFPDKAPDYPVLWVAYGGGKSAPFGEVVEAS